MFSLLMELALLHQVCSASMGVKPCDISLILGIYLMHRGYCLPEYTVISEIALTADNPLHCVLAGSSGSTKGELRWADPDSGKEACRCLITESGLNGNCQFTELDHQETPLTCSQSSSTTGSYSMQLFKNMTDSPESFSWKHSYTYACTFFSMSGNDGISATVNVLIESE